MNGCETVIIVQMIVWISCIGLALLIDSRYGGAILHDRMHFLVLVTAPLMAAPGFSCRMIFG